MPSFNEMQMLNQLKSQLAGQFMGILCKVGRPNYSQIDGTPIVVSPNIRFRIERSRPDKAQAEFRGLEYYAIFGPTYLLQQGDILTPTQAGTTTPPVTLFSYGPNIQFTAFRSARTGKITDGALGDIYTSVLFDQVQQGYPGASLESEIKSSLEIPTKTFVIYNRILASNNVGTDMHDAEGLLFIETDTAEQNKWIIKEVNRIGTLMLIVCKRAII